VLMGRAVKPKDEADRLYAYWSSSCDREAWQMLGIKRSTYTMWRWLRQLPPKRKQGDNDRIRQERADRRAQRLEAYHRWPDDAAAAAALGVSVGAFRRWRQRQGLPHKPQSKAP